MNHHEEEGIVDGMNGIEKESWTTTGVVEGEMRKCKACKFLISSWVDMGRPPMKIASNLNFRRHLALPTFDQDYPIKESPQFLPTLSPYIFIRIALWKLYSIWMWCSEIDIFRIGRELEENRYAERSLENNGNDGRLSFWV